MRSRDSGRLGSHAIRNSIVGCASCILAAIGISLISPAFYLAQWSSWIIYGVLALSLVWVWGRGGIFSFGQGAFFGIGAYVYGLAAINLLPWTGETISSIAIATAAAGITAACLGYFMFYGKIGDIYIAIVTLAVSLVLETFMASTADRSYRIGEAYLGGYNGMVGIPPLGAGGTQLSYAGFFILVSVVASLLVFGFSLLDHSPFGRCVVAVRENELRSQLLGYDVSKRKLMTFALGGLVAGLAGALFSCWALFINPEVFGLQLAAMIVIWVLLGGRNSYIGAFLGTGLVQGMSTFLGGVQGGVTPLVLGVVLIVIVLALPKGLAPTFVTLMRRFVGERDVAGPKLDASPGLLDRLYPSPGGAELAVQDLVKRFGHIAAVNGLNLGFAQRGVNCVIGPNGAGKSSVFNLLAGRFAPSQGRILLRGIDITRMESDKRARNGLGIKLQVPCIYPGLTVRENLWLAAYAGIHDAEQAYQRAADMADWMGLVSCFDAEAGILAHGQQQWLEIGMVLLTSPSVILLDEPTAGMTREETSRTAALTRELGEKASVIVVEHDMDFVRQLGVTSTVLHQGKVFALGQLDELRKNEAVLDIYLGRRRQHADA